MKFENIKRDKGVAGLTILLSLVTMLFVIGLLVFIFAIMGDEIKSSSSIAASETATTTDTSLTLASEVVTLTACAAQDEGTITSVATVYNDTTLVTSGNYTFSGCVLDLTAGELPYNESLGNVTYTYTYAGDGYDVVNDTTGAIVGVTDWYEIFIVIAAMVVLILLTVIIITAIRGSGLMTGGTGGGAGNVGSA